MTMPDLQDLGRGWPYMHPTLGMIRVKYLGADTVNSGVD